jgi:hypothetical protein
MSLIRKCNCDMLTQQLQEERTKNAILQSQVLELTSQIVMYKDLTSNTSILKSLVETKQNEKVELDDNTVFEKLPSINDTELTELSKNLTVGMLRNGISGVCFLLKDYLEARVVMTNASSGNFAFKYNRKIVSDVKCGLLSEIIVRCMQQKVLELAPRVTDEFTEAAEKNESANTDNHVTIIRQLNWIKKLKHELCKAKFTTCLKKIVKTKSAYVSSHVQSV